MLRTIIRVGFLPALLIIAALLFLLQGCGDNAPSTEGKTVITFWHFQSEPGQKKALEERVKAFEAENPTIHVDMQDLSWNDGKTKLMAAFSSNTAPDVVELGSDWVAQFSAAEVLADQKPMGGDSLGRFSEEIAAPGKWRDGVYAWPWTTDTRVLFYNKALLSAAGVDTNGVDSTWEQIVVKGEKVRGTSQQNYGFGANGADRHRLYKKILPFFWSNGGEVLNANGVPVINSPANIAALEKYLELARAGFIDSQRGLDQLFISGKLAYWISGPWLVDKIAKDNPSLRYGVEVLPGFPGHKAVSFAGGEYLAINAGSQHKSDAKKLITFLTSAKQALEFAKALPGGTTPADLSLANDPFLQNGARQVFTRQLASARMTPVNPKWLDIEEVVEDEVSAALLASKSAEQALNDAQYRVNQLIQNGAPETGEDTTK
ncbi:MAG: sugar ABC transporter substrate-binding protein [Bacteroidetes bacterium]|nr:sugar ABC transporter substrate-binding protein [Bacteroidota bacterium]